MEPSCACQIAAMQQHIAIWNREGVMVSVADANESCPIPLRWFRRHGEHIIVLDVNDCGRGFERYWLHRVERVVRIKEVYALVDDGEREA